MEDNRELWQNVLTDIELNISKANFSTWFKDTYILKREDGTVYLSVPNQFVKDWLASKYHKFIVRSLRNFAEDVRNVEYVIERSDRRTSREQKQQQPVQQPNANNELPLSDFYVSKEDNLNPRYTFESFVVGQFNELAYAAAQAIIKKPGVTYNPLFVYGGTGHGKTHLIQAIGNYVKQANPNKKTLYVTSEKFTVDYLNAVQNAHINSFKEAYRKYDVLIMDDVQFFSKKDKTQEELFHIFNALHDNNKQIVFSSDKHPNYIPSMEERLKSRFNAGMIVDIPAPDYESRIAILKAKAAQQNIPLEDDVVGYIAEQTEGNIRELEGILNMLAVQLQVKQKRLTINDVKQLIRENVAPKRSMSVQEVVQAIANFYQITEEDIYEKTRRKEVVRPRQLIMYVLREDFKVSYPTIGEKLGRRDHTTVIHSCEKVKEDLKVDATLARELEELRSILK